MKNIITLTLLALSFNAIAQTDADAFRFSGQAITGTARYSAMAGAFGAVGGDFTTLSHNPAGIGIYRSSEFSFTPSVSVNSTTSSFLNNSFTSSKSHFNVGNLGLVFTNTLSNNPTSPGWKSWNFGFGYNRLQNFNSQIGYEGNNIGSSMLNSFAENATGLNYNDLDGFYEYPAYAAFLINPDSLNHYFPAISGGDVYQKQSIENSGGMGELAFTFGGNYSNQLYFGLTMGVTSIRYMHSSVYEESAKNPADTLNNWRINEDVTTHGSGIDFRFGMIYRANDMFRFGFAIQTPTWYSMQDDYNNTVYSKFDIGNSYTIESPAGHFDYDMTTPFSAMGSVAVILGKQGLISADYEYRNYSDARFGASGTTFASVNNLIQQKYLGTHTVRIGGELQLAGISLRGGFSMETAPLDEKFKAGDSDYSKISFSGGIGFRPGSMFIDLGYVYTMSDEFYQPYTLETIDVPGIKNQAVISNIVATVGVKF